MMMIVFEKASQISKITAASSYIKQSKINPAPGPAYFIIAFGTPLLFGIYLSSRLNAVNQETSTA
jgi:hypothetical protein